MAEIVEIDGSVLEGGGQVLRISVALSAILGIPIRVNNIRAGRPKPGLAAQHLKGIQLVAEMCQAKLKGDYIGSSEIEFIPGKIRGGTFEADTKTAGSVSLLLQVALPVALAAPAPVTLELRGGTNADMAPQIDFMGEVFRYMLNKFGADFSLDVHKRGYYPKGGGHVTVGVEPARLRAAELTVRGASRAVVGWSFVAGAVSLRVARQMAGAATQQVITVLSNVSIECYQEDKHVAPDNCGGIILTSAFSSGCVVGTDGICRRGGDALAVGREAGAEIVQLLESDICVDRHTQDQLIIYMALAEGQSSVRAGEITLHTKTAIHIAEIMTQVKFTIVPDEDTNIIKCTGLGTINTHLQT